MSLRRRPSNEDIRHLTAGDHGNPHAILGAHPATVGKQSGVAIRAMMPDAVRCECVLADGSTHEMELLASGACNVFGCLVTLSPFVASLLRVDSAKGTVPDDRVQSLRFTQGDNYRFRFHFPNGETWERGDPYRFQ